MSCVCAVRCGHAKGDGIAVDDVNDKGMESGYDQLAGAKKKKAASRRKKPAPSGKRTCTHSSPLPKIQIASGQRTKAHQVLNEESSYELRLPKQNIVRHEA